MSSKDCPCQIKVVTISGDNYVTIETSTDESPKVSYTLSNENEIKLDTLTEYVIRKGYSPYIGENGNWWEYDDIYRVFVDTGVYAGREAIDEPTILSLWQCIEVESE